MITKLARGIGFALMAWFAMIGATSAAPLRVGAPAPEISGQTLDGAVFDLAALHGHVVIVNVWATWCAPCRAEMPTLNAFYEAHRNQGLVMIGASADRPRDVGEVRGAMRNVVPSAHSAKRSNQ